jgi:hypothetical protein
MKLDGGTNMKKIMGMLWLGLFLMASADTQAGNVVGLTPFTSGTTAKASEVNGNFDAVKTAVDDNYSRLTAAGAVSISAFAFSEATNNTEDTFGCHLKRSLDFDYFENPGFGCRAAAPLSLPHGATITSISCLVYHDAAETTSNIYPVTLNRIDLSTGTEYTLFDTSTPTTAIGLQTLTSTPATGQVVNNNNNAYDVYVDFDLTGLTSPIGLRLYGCKVSYQP